MHTHIAAMAQERKRCVVLISGNGSNLQVRDGAMRGSRSCAQLVPTMEM